MARKTFNGSVRRLPRAWLSWFGGTMVGALAALLAATVVFFLTIGAAVASGGSAADRTSGEAAPGALRAASGREGPLNLEEGWKTRIPAQPRMILADERRVYVVASIYKLPDERSSRGGWLERLGLLGRAHAKMANEKSAHIFALDKKTGRILWRRDFSGGRASGRGAGAFFPERIQPEPALTKHGLALLLTESIYTRLGELHMVGRLLLLDPATGRTLWRSRSLADGFALFQGGRAFVAQGPFGRGRSVEAVDLAGRRTLWTSKLASLKGGVGQLSVVAGQLIVESALRSGRKEFAAFDQATGMILWSRTVNPKGRLREEAAIEPGEPQVAMSVPLRRYSTTEGSSRSLRTVLLDPDSGRITSIFDRHLKGKSRYIYGPWPVRGAEQYLTAIRRSGAGISPAPEGQTLEVFSAEGELLWSRRLSKAQWPGDGAGGRLFLPDPPPGQGMTLLDLASGRELARGKLGPHRLSAPVRLLGDRLYYASGEGENGPGWVGSVILETR